ncbi:MAG: zinc ribbon domain-containing protein [Oscillospiraceae bacterium]|nr:zinc ribbon domain-containing protein [Oscillospiraceae bacterium]
MARFCLNCGKQLNETVKFCASCGAQQQPTQQPSPVQSAQLQQQPQTQPYIQPQYQYQQPYAPTPKKKSKTPLIVGSIGGVLVIVLVIVLISTNVFGLISRSGGDTPTDQNGITQPTGDDAVFTNALVGSWGRVGYNANTLPIWVFGEDGRFAYYDAVALKPDFGTAYSPSHYECWTQGKYRVNGYFIELYDCMESSYFEYTYANSDSWRYGFNAGGSPENISANELLNSALPEEPLKIDNFTATFEFFSGERLHLIFVYKEDGYDAEFNYMSGSRDIDVLTYTLPGLAWPKDSLPSIVPEYIDGRIQKADYHIDDFNGKWYFNAVIDRTTCGYVWKYSEGLIADGWLWVEYGFDNAEEVEDWLLRGYYVRLRDKDNECEINININIEGRFMYSCYEW